MREGPLGTPLQSQVPVLGALAPPQMPHLSTTLGSLEHTLSQPIEAKHVLLQPISFTWQHVKLRSNCGGVRGRG